MRNTLRLKAVVATIAAITMTASVYAHEDKDLNDSVSWNIHQGKNEIVLTIDDGPTVGVTDKMLDVLKKYNVKATFFVVGSRLNNNNRFLLRRMSEEGHIVANHTVTHPNFSSISARAAKKEILDAQDLIDSYVTNTQYNYFRPPGGSWRSSYASTFNRFNSLSDDFKGPVNWDIGGSVNYRNGQIYEAADWACWSKKMTVRTCLEGYIKETLRKKGGVVLFHDLRSMSAELFEGYIKYFSSRDDYRIVTLDEVSI